MQSIFCPLPRFIPGRITTWLVLSQEAATLELQLCRGQVSGIGSFSFIWSDRDACLLDVPYHKYHLLFVSGLPGLVRSWLKFYLQRAWRRPLIYSRGLAAGESSDRAESIRTRKKNSQIPVAQWPEWKSFSLPGGMRDVGRGRMLLRDHKPSSSVSQRDENLQQTACWLPGVTWWFRI